MEIYEILEAVGSAQTREEKQKILGDNDCLALRDIMKINFDDNLTIHISKKINWSPNSAPTKSLRDITKYLVPLSKGDVSLERADKSFKAMLESIHPMDAQYLVEASKKKLKVKGLTKMLIENTWGTNILK